MRVFPQAVYSLLTFAACFAGCERAELNEEGDESSTAGAPGDGDSGGDGDVFGELYFDVRPPSLWAVFDRQAAAVLGVMLLGAEGDEDNAADDEDHDRRADPQADGAAWE